MTTSEHPHDVLRHIKRKTEILSRALREAEESIDLSDAFSMCCMDLESDLYKVIEKLENPEGFNCDVPFKEAEKSSKMPSVYWFRAEGCYNPNSNSHSNEERGFVVPILVHSGFTFKIVLDNFQVIEPKEPLYFNTLIQAIEGGKNWFTLKFAKQPLD